MANNDDSYIVRLDESGMQESVNKITASFDAIDKAANNTAKRIDSSFSNAGNSADRISDGINRAKDSFSNASRSIETQAQGLTGSLNSIGMAVAGAFTIDKAIEFGKQIIDVRGELESMQVVFENIAGKEKGGALFQGIKDWSFSTPMQINDVAHAGQTLLAFGVESDRIMPILKQLGDISAGDSERFQRLSLAYAQNAAAGKLMGQDLLQMVNAGFNPLQEMSKKTGKSLNDLREEMAKGNISTKMVEDAFAAAAAKGGKFYGTMDAISKKIKGQMSNLKDAVTRAMDEIGSNNESTIAGGIASVRSLVDNYQEVGKVISVLIATYGAYKAAVITVTAVEKAEAFTRLASIQGTTALGLAVDVLRGKIYALNAAIMANPYTYLFTGVVAAMALMVAFSEKTNVAEESLKQWNDRQKDQNKILDEKKQKLSESIDAINDENKTENEKQAVLDSLKKMMPSVFSQYKTWIDLQNHLKDATAAANKELSNQRTMQGVGNLKNDQNALKDWKQFLNVLQNGTGDQGEKMYQMMLKKYPQDFKKRNLSMDKLEDFVKQQISSKQSNIIKDNKAFRPQDNANFEESLSKMNLVQAQATAKFYSNLLQNAEKSGNKFFPEAIALFKSRLNDANTRVQKIITDRGVDFLGKNKAAYEKAQKELVDVVKNRNNRDLYPDENAYKAAYKAAQDKVKSTKTDYEQTGGSTKEDKKAETAAERAAKKAKLEQEREAKAATQRRDTIRKLSLEEGQIRADLQQKISEMEMSAMEEGYAKKRRQLDEDYKKQIQEINKNEAEELNKRIEAEKALFNLNPKNKGKTFNSSSVKLPDSIQSLYDAQRGAAGAGYEEKEKEYNKSVLLEHQDYIDKKADIDKKYNDYITELDRERAEAQKRNDTEAVDHIDRSKSQAQKDYVSDTAKNSLDKLKEDPAYIRAFDDLKNTSTDTLNMLISKFEDTAKAQKDLSPTDLKAYMDIIKQMGDEIGNRDPFAALSKSLNDYRTARDAYNQANSELVVAKKTGRVQVGVKTDNASREAVPVYNNLAQAQEKAAKSADDYAKAGNNLQKAVKTTSSLLKDITSKIDAIGNSIGGMVGNMISLIGQVGSTVIDAVEGFATVDKTASASIQALEKASVILTIISTAVQVFNKISSMFGADYSGYEAMKSKYEALVKVWDDLIAKKKEYINESYGTEISKTEQEIQATLRKEIEAYQTLGKARLNAGSSRFSHTIGYRMADQTSENDWKNIASSLGWTEGYAKNIIGTGRMTGLFDLTADQLKKLKDGNQVWWAQLDNDVKTYLEDIINANDAASEAFKDAETKMNGTSFSDFIDNFESMLEDMGSDTDTFSKDWEKKMEKSIISALIVGKYKSQLQNLYDSWYSAANSDNSITSAEYQTLQEQWDAIMNSALEERNNLMKLYGWTNTDRSGSTASTVQASQESVDILTGIDTNIEQHTYTIVGLMPILIANSSKALEHLAGIETNTREANGKIDDTNKRIDDTNKRIDDVKSTVVSIKTSMDNIETRGLKLRQ